MNHPLRMLPGPPVRAALIIMATLLPGGQTITGADNHTFTDVMRRAHEYTVIYEDHELSTVRAREHYQQQRLDAGAGARMKAERALISDYVLIQLPPNEDWFALRDVYDVDGVQVNDREERLKDLFSRPRELQGDRGTEIMKESERFNLAPDLYYRTVNVPTFALRFLRPVNRSWVVFGKAGEKQVGNTLSWIIRSRETRGPTRIRTPEGRDVPAHGRFWVDPDTGAVLRSEIVAGGTRRIPVRATITVTYGLEPALGFRVPIEMLER